MPVLPGSLERVVLLNLNQAPGVFLDLLGTAAFQCVLAALRLGAFEALRDGPLTAAEVAHKIEASERGTAALLNALAPLGYLKLKNGRFSNTPMTTKWLLKDAPLSVAPGLEFWGMLLFEFWADLDQSIRDGGPQVDFYREWLSERPGGWPAFQQFMITGNRTMADEIVRRVKLPPTARRLLDVAGGHGLYSVAFCRQYPQLTATVFDLPGAIKMARELISTEQMDGQVVGQEGDFWEDDLGSGYDVILLFNILHTHLPEPNRRLLQKVAAALNPGGMVIILEQLLGKMPGSFGKIFANAANLNFFHMVGGQGYTAEEMAGWLGEIGLTGIETISLRSLPGNGVVWGSKST